MTETETLPSSLEDDIVKNFNLHRKWKKTIVELVKKQVNMIEEPEEWSDILEDWAWFRDPHPFVLKTLDLLAKYRAASAYLLATYYVVDDKDEFERSSRKEIEVLAARFRRVFTKLHRAGLVYADTIMPDSDTVLRNAVTIWITPFAKESDIASIRDFYRKVGGTRRKPEKVDKKTAKDISEHNRKVKVMAILDKYRDTKNLNDHYKCPKKHPEGFKSPRKAQSHWKKTKYIRKCPACERELVQISYKAFMDLKKKSLCEEWGIKL